MPQIIYRVAKRTTNWGERALQEWNELKPVLSILMIVATLLGLVFVQMEERRMGYAIFKMSRGYKEKVDERRGLEIQLAQSLRLEKLERLASKRLTLKRAQNHQVIYLNDQNSISEIGKELAFEAAPAIPAQKSKLVALKSGDRL